MSLQNGDLDSRLTLDFSQFTQGLRTAARQAQRAGNDFRRAFQDATRGANDTGAATRTVSSDFRDLERIVGGIVLSQAFYGAVTAIKEASAAVLEFTGNMEKAQISFEYFLGSSERATGFIENMKDFSAETAFNTEQAMGLSKKLLNAGFQANQVRDIMERLNDTAAVSGMTPDVIDRIVLAMTQMKTSGKIMGTEMRQLAEANIPVYKILAEQLGLTGEEILKIGKLEVNSDVGLAAIFQGLEQFDGAALKVAETMSGMQETIKDNALIISEKMFAKPYAALKGLVRVIRDTMEEVRGHLTEGGLGKVLEEMVPPEFHGTIRIIAGSLLSLGRAFIDWHKAMAPVVGILIGGIAHALSIVLPVVANLTRAIVTFADSALTAIPPLKYLIAALGGLMVASVAAKSLMLLWSVTRMGVIAGAVAKLVMKLVTAVRLLTIAMISNPIIAGIVLVGGALLWLAAQTKFVSDWIDRLMAGLASLGGFDINEILQPEELETDKWMEEFNGEIESLEDALKNTGTELEDIGDKGKEAGDKIKKSFIAAFDEVFQVPEQEKDEEDDPGLDAGELPGLGGGGDKDKGGGPKPIDLPRKIDLPELVWPDMPLFPPFPPLPPLPEFAPIRVPSFAPLVTAWTGALERIRVGTGDFGTWWQEQVAKFPTTFPLPNVGPLLEGLRGLAGEIGGVFGGLGNFLQESWRTTWEIMSYPQPAWATITGALGVFGDTLAQVWQTAMERMTFPMPAWGTATLTYLTGIATTLVENLALMATGMGAALQIGWDTSLQAVTSWGSNVLDAIVNVGVEWGAAIATAVAPMIETLSQFGAATLIMFQALWPEIQKTMSNFGQAAWDILKGIGETLVQFWEDHKVAILLVVGGIIAGIVLFFTGLPAGVIAAIAALVARVGPAFARMGPAIMRMIKGIPGQITKLWDKLPNGVQTALTKMVDKFKALPGLIWEAIKGIPGKIADVFGDIKIPSFSQIGGSITGSFSKLGDVAGFANGGIIGNDSIVRVGEKGRREAIVPLQNDTAMAPFVNAVVRGLGGINTGGGNTDREPQPPVVYVQHLIADERGLKELERRMRVIRLGEGKRGGARG